MRRVPLNRKTPLRAKKPWRWQEKEYGIDKPPKKRKTSMRHRTPTRAAEEKTYKVLRIKFLSKLQDTPCPVMMELKGEWNQITQVHHMAGRWGRLLNDVGKWLGVSDEGHKWINQNGKESIKRGWVMLRGK